jgi:hypothetical protein
MRWSYGAVRGPLVSSGQLLPGRENLRSYIQAFTPAVRDIFESVEFHLQVDRLDKAGLLYMVCERQLRGAIEPVAQRLMTIYKKARLAYHLIESCVLLEVKSLSHQAMVDLLQ